MILLFLILWLFAGGLASWLAGRWSPRAARWVALLVTAVQLVVVAYLWLQTQSRPAAPGEWLYEVDWPWIAPLGVSFYLAMDGLSLVLVLLTAFLGFLSVAASWQGIQERVGLFHFMTLWILAAITGSFLALDLFAFVFFWEMMLIPLYFLIGIWGHENRIYATIKFFIFTQASSLFMLVSILGLYVAHGRATGQYTFNYNALLNTPMDGVLAFWLMLGFFLAFAVKLPAVPVHTWLPDAHTEAPTAGSVILAGLLLKVGAYGFLRFVVPLFPQAAHEISTFAMALGVLGILYGALVAFGQTDLKRLVANSSISHMGFVLLGIFAWNQLALQGAVIVILAHGISTGALFTLVGDLADRTHTRDMSKMGGLFIPSPRLGGFTHFFALASLGLPGLGNFVGEILVLFGAWQVNQPLTVLATLGFIVSTVYSLWMVQRTFHGPNDHNWILPPYNARETAIMAVFTVAIVVLGLYPQPMLDTTAPALQNLQERAARTGQTLAPPAEHVAVAQGGER